MRKPGIQCFPHCQGLSDPLPGCCIQRKLCLLLYLQTFPVLVVVLRPAYAGTLAEVRWYAGRSTLVRWPKYWCMLGLRTGVCQACVLVCARPAYWCNVSCRAYLNMVSRPHFCAYSAGLYRKHKAISHTKIYPLPLSSAKLENSASYLVW